MKLDIRIVEAIRSATEKAGQSKELSSRIVAWMEALANGNEDIHDEQVAGRRLELLYEETLPIGSGRKV